MNQEQKERLTVWSIDLFIRYKIDFFRGVIISDIINLITTESTGYIESATTNCSAASELGFIPDQKNFDELQEELNKLMKVIPLNQEAANAIVHVFAGRWEQAIEELHKLSEE
jgi:hypothetical protein